MARTFYQRLKELGYATYDDYLRGREWLAFRARYRTSRRPQLCAVCSCALVTLHHVTYERLGYERLSDVIPLCWDHHGALHGLLKRKRWGLKQSKRAVTILKGLPDPGKARTYVKRVSDPARYVYASRGRGKGGRKKRMRP